jgi:hypothetical protein
MRYADCVHCGKLAIPANETVFVDSQAYCIKCYEDLFLQEKGKLEGKTVARNIDETICHSCGADNGDEPFNKISVYPFCDNCTATIRRRTFPQGVKIFFIALGLIIILSFLFNFRYYKGYRQMNQAKEAIATGDYANAADRMTNAAENVSESKELRALSQYLRGLDYLNKNESDKALNEFFACSGQLPESYELDKYIRAAKEGAAFDQKSYSEYLGFVKEDLQSDTSQAMNWASVASAYACLYAENGQDSLKILSKTNLDHAKQIDDSTDAAKFYYNLVEYRLAKRSVIKRDEFAKQFPNGWPQN